MIIIGPTCAVNTVAFLTLSYFPAPQLYAQTGWKPCPNPRRAEKIKKVTLPVMLIAAMAASPYTAALRFKRIVAILASPCLASDGSPVFIIADSIEG